MRTIKEALEDGSISLEDEIDYPDMTEEEYKEEIERLNKKIEQYENPEDMTLMFMWCDEKAKDEIKRLNNIINELEKTLLEWHEYWESDDDYGFEFKEVYDYLQELKGDKNNDN